jgi:transcriptional repressor NrdR
MNCIYCGGSTKVVNSRPQKRLQQVWRRRQCQSCQAVFTTLEAAALGGSLIVRRQDSSVQPFSRDTLFASILKACGHRSEAVNDAGALTATIIARLQNEAQTAALDVTRVIATTLEVLQRFDEAAAVQYRAYHRLG